MFDSNGEITPTLRGSYHGQTNRAIFQHTCFQPLTQQLEHSTIREPPRQRTQGSGGTTSAGCCGAWKVGAGADGASSSVCQTSILLQSSTGRPSRKTEGVPPRRNPMPSWVSWTMRLRPVPCVTRWATAAPSSPALRPSSAQGPSESPPWRAKRRAGTPQKPSSPPPPPRALGGAPVAGGDEVVHPPEAFVPPQLARGLGGEGRLASLFVDGLLHHLVALRLPREMAVERQEAGAGARQGRAG